MRGKSLSSVLDRDFANMYRTKNRVRERIAKNFFNEEKYPARIVSPFFGT